MNQGFSHKTVLISDLVDSTVLIEKVGDENAATIFARHDKEARALIDRYEGREIDKSDGFLLLFDRPINAALYSLAYHQMLASLSKELEVVLQSRVGIHFGEVYLRSNPEARVLQGAKPVEVEGIAKPLAARLMSLASGNQTLLTRGAYDLASRSAVDSTMQGRESLIWLSHGQYDVKGLTEPLEVFEVGLEDLSPLRAPADTQKVHRVEERPGENLPTVLVFPFDNYSSDKRDEFLTDALTDEIISDLSKLGSLKVLSRTSAAQLKNKAKDLKSIGTTMKVEFVVEGSVTRAGEPLRVTVKLADTKTEELIWSDKFIGPLEDIFAIQEEIARQIVSALEIKVSDQESERLGERPIPDIRAYEFYLLAKREITRYREDSLENAMRYLQKGMEILGDNLLLKSAMGYFYWQYFNAGLTTDRGYLEKAKNYAEEILSQDPTSAHGHRLMGLVGMHEGDMQQTVLHLKRALDQDPNDTDSLFWLPLMYGYAGRSSAGYALVDRLLKIDPLTPFYNCLPGWLLLLEGDFDLAPESLLRSYNMDPASPMLRYCYGHSLAMSGRTHEACIIFDLFLEDMPDNFHTGLAQLSKWALLGDQERALEATTEDLTNAAITDFQYSWNMAQYLSLVGDLDASLKWLTNAVDLGFINYPLFAEHDPFLENLRKHAGFDDLMVKTQQLWSSLET